MRKFPLVILLVTFLSMCTFSSYAQDNVVKLGIGSIFYKNLNLKYERVINDNSSFQVGLLLNFRSTLPGSSVIQNNFNIEELENATFGGFAIVPEYRFYLGKNDAPRGFYLGAYGKFGSYSAQYDNALVGSKDVVTDFKVGTIQLMVGGQMGVQFLIGDAFSIDWLILGVGGGAYMPKVGYEAESVLNYSRGAIIQDISDAIDDETIRESILDILDPVIEDVNAKEYSSPRFPFGMFDLRTGVSIGYAF